jgi:hypothetical protein
MQMRDLRGKTPEMFRKEVWAHVPAYNLIRTVTAQAAATHDVVPRSIRFTGAMQTLAAFRPLLEFRTARGTAICSTPSPPIVSRTAPTGTNRG